MKSILMVLIGATLLASCSACNNNPFVLHHVADVTMYKSRFDADMQLLGRVPVVYFNLRFEQGSGGHCTINPDHTRTLQILVNTTEFSWYTYYIFLHEMGHALHSCSDADHVTDRASIMNPDQNMIIYEEFRDTAKRLQYLKDVVHL